jgi:hypothetical protein
MSRLGVLAHIVLACVFVFACGGRGDAKAPQAYDFCPTTHAKMKPMAECIEFVKDAPPERRTEVVKSAAGAVCSSFASREPHETEEVHAFENKEKTRYCCEYGARTKFVRGSEFEEITQSLVRLACARSCFVGSEANACKYFEGPEGENRHLLACASSGEEAVCRGIDPDKVDQVKAEQRAKREAEYSALTSGREERNRQIIANNAVIRADLARKAAAQQARREVPVAPPTRTTPRKNCQYMFLTGGHTSSGGWEKLERHFYDAPDCGGSCCGGQSFCCLEKTSGKEFCSATTAVNSGRTETEEHYCSGAASPRDRRRDDYPVLPVLPGK